MDRARTQKLQTKMKRIEIERNTSVQKKKCANEFYLRLLCLPLQ